MRINAAVRNAGLTYSTFMNALKGMNVALDRKVLAEMAYDNDANFASLIESAKRFIEKKNA
jgi:large subunit ribosomal protein L20